MKYICNDRELRCAYEALKIIEDFCPEYTEKVLAKIRETKKAIREYNARPIDESRVIKADFDSMVALIRMPDYINSDEAAVDYFDEAIRREAQPSMYDCTGQIFTVWWKIFKRHGRYWVYHATAMDV